MADNNVEMQGIEIKITGDSSGYEKSVGKAVKKTSQFKSVLKEAQRIYAEQRPQLKFDTSTIDSAKKKISGLAQKMKDSIKGAASSINKDFAKIETPKMRWDVDSGEQMPQEMWDRLTQTIERLQEATKGPVKVDVDAAEAEKATGIIGRLRDRIQQMKGAVNDSNIGSFMGRARQNYKDAGMLPDKSGGGDGGNGDAMEDVGEKASKSSGKLKEFLSTLGSKLTSAASSAVSSLKKVAKALGPKLLSGLKKAGTAAKDLAKTLASKLTAPISKAVSGFNKLGKSFARIAMYRAVRAVLSSISQALKDGVNNIYQYSKALDGSLSKSMDSIATNVQLLKNSLGSIAAPIINAVAPAIDALVSKIVTLSNAIAQLFAKLGGQSTFTEAARSATTYADAASGAAAANKDFTAGFDELNILSNSSGGGGGSTADYGSMFEEVPIDAEIGSFADKLKAAFDVGDFEGIGSIVGEKLNSIIDSVDFESWGNALGEKVSNAIDVALGFLRTVDFVGIGQSLAEGLNGVMESLDFADIGALLAEKWNVLIDTWYGFVSTFDWSAFGTKISTAVNSWFENVRLDTAAAALVAGINGVIDAAWNFLTGLDVSSITTTIATAISKAIEGINFKKAGQTLGKAFSTVFDSITQTIKKINWKQLGTDIAEFVAGIDWCEVVESLSSAIDYALAGFGQLLIGLITPAWESLTGWWKDTAYEDGKFTMEGLLDGIAKKLESIHLWFKEHVFDPIVNAFKDLFGIHSPSTVFAELGNSLIDGLMQGISDMWKSVTTFFSGSWTDLKEGFLETWASIKEGATEKWQGVKETLADTWDEVKEAASEKWSGIKGAIVDTWNDLDKSDLPSFIASLSSKLSEGWDSIKKTASEKWSNIKDTIVGFFKGTKNEVEGISDDIQAAASSASSAVSNIKSSKNKVLAGSGYTMEAYASGGFVDQGSLFVAGEAGPEMVGRINGKTAVANSDQIVQAVANGVAGANSSVVSALYTLIDVVQSIDTSVVIGDDEIGRSYDRYSTGRGARVNTGAFANAY